MYIENVPPRHLCTLLALIFIHIPSSAFGGRPLVIDDAPVVSQNHLEIELGLSHARPENGGREQKSPILGLTYGLGRGLELALNIHRSNSDSRGEPPVRGFEDLHLAPKYNFFEESDYLPALTFSLDVKIPTANRRKGLSTGRMDENLLFIATKRFSDLAVDFNAGYLIVNSPAAQKLKNRAAAGFALRWEMDKQWGMVGEIHGQSRRAKGERNEANFQLGVKYLLADPLVLDAAVGRSLRSSGNNFQATLGVTWTFPVNF